MKTPDPRALETLKTKVVDPIIAGNASNNGNAGVTAYAGVAGNANNGQLKKFTIRIDSILLGRIRTAYLNQLAHGGPHRSLSAWAAHQLEVAVNTAEVHNGREFTPTAAGEIPTGPLNL